MEYIPYATQTIDETDIDALCETLRSGWLTQGPAVPAFEAQFAAVHDVDHAVAVSNATCGLHLACLVLGVGPGQSVWTSPISFVASANCALYCGASVDFVDIDPITRNMSPIALAAKLQEAELRGKLPSVVIPVHFAGLPCDMVAIYELGRRYGFKIIEDASHAVGARLEGQPMCGRYSDLTVFSFHPVKIITTGEGGMIVTKNGAYADKLRSLRSHGITRDSEQMEFGNSKSGDWYYEQLELGFNYRMTDLQAALGLSQLARLERFHEARQQLAGRYDLLLRNMPFKLPARNANSTSSWHLYVIEVDDENAGADRLSIFQHMRAEKIGVNVHYIPIHTQPHYRKMGFVEGQFPNAENYYRKAISIPLFPALSEQQQDRVVRELDRALQR